jgi:hypothetical protein
VLAGTATFESMNNTNVFMRINIIPSIVPLYNSKAWWPRRNIEEFASTHGKLSAADTARLFEESLAAVSEGLKLTRKLGKQIRGFAWIYCKAEREGSRSKGTSALRNRYSEGVTVFSTRAPRCGSKDSASRAS